jgi:hypothetical protein
VIDEDKEKGEPREDDIGNQRILHVVRTTSTPGVAAIPHSEMVPTAASTATLPRLRAPRVYHRVNLGLLVFAFKLVLMRTLKNLEDSL